MPTPGRPTDNLDDAIKLYESSDRGIDSIADELNVGRRVLRTALVQRGTLRDQRTANALAKARGDQTRAALRAELPADEIARAYVGGASEKALAERYGTSRHRIGGVLNRAGVTRRTIADANRVMSAGRSAEEHARNLEAAHAAARGRTASYEELCRRAIARHGKVTSNATELLYAAWLRLRGIEVVHQHALGPYNIDLTAAPVAVEIFGGNWHAWGHHAATVEERARYICDQGWLLVVVWVNRDGRRLTEASADYIAAQVELARRDPSVLGQYRVVWCDGQVVPVGGRDFHELARVPARRSRPDAR